MTRKIFLTECNTPNGNFSGPHIYANTWDEAENQVLQIKHWLNTINQPHHDLKVLGQLEAVIPVNDDGTLDTVAKEFLEQAVSQIDLTIVLNDYTQIKPSEPGWYLCVVSEVNDLGKSQYYEIASWANYADVGDEFDCCYEKGLTVLYWAELPVEL